MSLLEAYETDVGDDDGVSSFISVGSFLFTKEIVVRFILKQVFTRPKSIKKTVLYQQNWMESSVPLV